MRWIDSLDGSFRGAFRIVEPWGYFQSSTTTLEIVLHRWQVWTLDGGSIARKVSSGAIYSQYR